MQPLYLVLGACAIAVFLPSGTEAGKKWCGLKRYEENTHMCCGTFPTKKIVPKTVGGKATSCCGNDWHIPSIHLCCKRTRVAKPPNGACCGKKAYNTATQHCCGILKKIWPKTATNHCCGNKVCEDTTKKCGVKNYDSATHHCCGVWPFKKIVPKVVDGKETQCCGNDYHIPAEQLCCRKTRVNKLPGGVGQCCGRKVYNPATQHCCGIFKRIHPKTETNFCCGNAACEPTTKRCGFRRYDTKTHLCCRWKIILRTSDTQQCCGRATYEPATQICCGRVFKKIHPRNNSTTLQCCGQTTYEPATQRCCRGRVHPAKQGEICCGKNVYDQKTQRCCSGQPNPKTPTNKCCFRTVYDPSPDICCNLFGPGPCPTNSPQG